MTSDDDLSRASQAKADDVEDTQNDEILHNVCEESINKICEAHFQGIGTKCHAIIPGLGKITDILPSNDFNDCVDILIRKMPKNVLASMVEDIPSEKKRNKKFKTKNCLDK